MTDRAVVAVVTRDRARILRRFLLPSLTQAGQQGTPIIVVDQSQGEETRRLVQGVPSVRYVPGSLGLSQGRNLAIAETTESLILFTDDDVSFPPGWVEEVVAVFDREPTAGAVCGRATAGSQELLPGSPPGVYRWPASPFGLGSGFNMAFRREALVAAGPFDEALGAGARYRAGEDTDMLYRIMREGWSVVCSDDITVVHNDWRSAREQVRLSFNYGFGAGAQSAKHAAANDPVARQLVAREARRHVAWLVRKIVAGVVKEIALQAAFMLGLAAGFLRRSRELAAIEQPRVTSDGAGRDVDEPTGSTTFRDAGGGLP